VATGRTVIFLIAVIGLGLNALAFLMLAANQRTLHRRWGENLPQEDQSGWMRFRIRMSDKGWGAVGTFAIFTVPFCLGLLGVGGQ
jgi:hypothetical protein